MTRNTRKDEVYDLMLDTLKKCRGMIQGELIEHAVVNYPQRPQVSLGDHLDTIIKMGEEQKCPHTQL